MKKNIDTLVDDIYSLFDLNTENNIDEKDLDKHLNSFTEGVVETIKILLKEKHNSKRSLRLSAIGKPDRQLWYDNNLENNFKSFTQN